MNNRVTRLDRAAKATERRSRALPVVHAALYEPAGARHRYLAITSPCPYCGGRHHHFTGEAAGFNRKRAGCRGGRYLIRIARTYQRRGGTEVVIRAA